MSDYLEFWRVSAPIFNSPPGSQIFLPASQEQSFHRLRLFCEQGSSLMAVIAPTGHGKTTLAHGIRNSLLPKTHDVLLLSLYQSEHKSGWLLPKLAAFFGVALGEGSGGSAETLRKIGKGIDEIASEGRKLLLIIDDADRLASTEAFSEVTSLIAMQQAVTPVLSIMLLGTEGLSKHVDEPHIKNRLVLKVSHKPLEPREVQEYIAFKTKAAGLTRAIFSAEAVECIARHAAGIYRRIDALCENAMMAAFLSGQNSVSLELANQIATAESEGDSVQQAKGIAAIAPLQASFSLTEETKLSPPPTKPGASAAQRTEADPISLSSLFSDDDDF